MEKNRNNFFDLVVRLLALILAVSLLLGCIAGNIDPRDSKYIPFFGLAYPYLLIVNVLMVFWWLVRRRWTLVLLTLVIIGVGYPVVMTTFRFSGEVGPAVKSAPGVVRMMTYNVHNFTPFGGDVDPQVVRSNMLKVIKAEDPDIIAIQEYYSQYQGVLDVTDSLKEILHTQYFYLEPSFQTSDQAGGLAIFSKYPIKGKGDIVFDGNNGGNSAIYVDVEANNKRLRIYNVHLQSISFDPQDYAYLDKIKRKMDPELKQSRRILSMLRTAFVKRSTQVDILKNHMKGCNTPYLIAGDFNDTPASYSVRQLTKNLSRSFEEKGSGFGRTYNGKFPNFQIDYIAVTKNIRVLNHKVINAKLSDHFPVRSDLQFAP
jgi:endonuclease/exonuclease/phosphatase family metal-dependent hydrolase